MIAAPGAIRRSAPEPPDGLESWATDQMASAARLRAVQAPPLVPPVVVALLHRGVAATVATRDAGLRPHLARAWAPETLGPRGPIRLCVEARDSSTTAYDLATQPEIAVTLARPSTYQSVQMKGLILDVQEPDDRQLSGVDEHQAAFAADLEQVGFAARLVPRLVDRAALMSVTFELQELYDQTPGPAAGTAL